MKSWMLFHVVRFTFQSNRTQSIFGNSTQSPARLEHDYLILAFVRRMTTFSLIN